MGAHSSVCILCIVAAAADVLGSRIMALCRTTLISVPPSHAPFGPDFSGRLRCPGFLEPFYRDGYEVTVKTHRELRGCGVVIIEPHGSGGGKGADEAFRDQAEPRWGAGYGRGVYGVPPAQFRCRRSNVALLPARVSLFDLFPHEKNATVCLISVSDLSLISALLSRARTPASSQ